jgi:hypothetical protein
MSGRAYPKAAFVFAAIATELAWKDVLLRPMLAGLITLPQFVDLVTKLATTQQGFDRFSPLLIAILRHNLGNDINVLRRCGSNIPLAEEIKKIADRRSRVVHAGESVGDAEVSMATEVAQHLLRSVFPEIRRVLSVR